MKKNLFVVSLVAALVVLTVVADRYWKAGGKSAAKSSGGAAAPNFTLKDLNGGDVSLADYKGKVVIVNFWATWCGPCRIEMPWMIEFQEKYGPKGFTVLGLAMDDEGKSAVGPYIEKERFDVDGRQMAVNYPILLGTEAVADQFGLFGMPTSVVISRDGKITKRFIGLVNHDLLVKEIEAQIGR